MITLLDAHLIDDWSPKATLLERWLHSCAEDYGYRIGTLNYRFCDEAEMLSYNQTYLDHYDLTDILTFSGMQHRNADIVHGDILINTDRLLDNASKYNVTPTDELLRLMSHGLLHLMGYTDHTDEEKGVMREQEERCMALYRP